MFEVRAVIKVAWENKGAESATLWLDSQATLVSTTFLDLATALN